MSSVQDNSIKDTIFGIIAKEANVDAGKITLDSTLKELDIQSLDAVQIIFEIEDHYKITLPDRDPNFDTESVKGLVEAVEKLVAEKPAATATKASNYGPQRTQSSAKQEQAWSSSPWPHLSSDRAA